MTKWEIKSQIKRLAWELDSFNLTDQQEREQIAKIDALRVALKSAE
jgi:hypothetical protein